MSDTPNGSNDAASPDADPTRALPDSTEEYEALAEPLGAWLREHLAVDDAVVRRFERPGGGYSAETLIVPVTLTRGGSARDEQIVVRREMPEPPVYPEQVPVDTEIEIQWRVMSALAEHGEVPIAPLHGYETDPSVLGAPFFVMGFVAGDVPREDPNYLTEGFFVDAAPEERARMVSGGVDMMAGVHRVDVDRAGLGWLSPTDEPDDGRRQLRIWREYAERELGDRPHELMLAAFARLEEELPSGGDVVLTWGDARLGNIIWQDFAPACLTDFEAAALAPAEMDVGWWLMFEEWSHAMAGGIDRLPGTPSWDAQLDRYAAAGGRELRDIGPWVLFAAARYAAIVVRVMNRMVDRGLLPPDHDLYLMPLDPVLRTLLDA